jgi:flagellar biosynthesis protein FlhG
VISNKVESLDEGMSLFNKLNMVVTRYLKIPIEYLGAIPQDQLLSRAVMQQSPVSIQSPSAKSSKAFETLSATLMAKNEEQVYKRRGMAGFFYNFLTSKKL